MYIATEEYTYIAAQYHAAENAGVVRKFGKLIATVYNLFYLLNCLLSYILPETAFVWIFTSYSMYVL